MLWYVIAPLSEWIRNCVRTCFKLAICLVNVSNRYTMLASVHALVNFYKFVCLYIKKRLLFFCLCNSVMNLLLFNSNNKNLNYSFCGLSLSVWKILESSSILKYSQSSWNLKRCRRRVSNLRGLRMKDKWMVHSRIIVNILQQTMMSFRDWIQKNTYQKTNLEYIKVQYRSPSKAKVSALTACFFSKMIEAGTSLEYCYHNS